MKVQLDVLQTFVDSLISVTEEIVSFPLKHSKENITVVDAEEIRIQSRGVFRSWMCFQLERSLEEAIIRKMLDGKEPNPDLRKLYLGEYINILSGHALTRINNIVGQSSRLTVPIVGARPEIEEKTCEQSCVIAFTSEYGNMLLRINYELWE